MNARFAGPALLAFCLAPCAAFADSGQVELTTAGEFQQTKVTYDCGDNGSLDVSYVNADPNFLAVVPVSGETQPLVFASVLSGSGVRYAAGKYVWWSTGNTANLYDTTQDDNAPALLSCTQK
ncbi:Membrane-bound inhibitor of C-type lysozyme [Devosia sp. YR412]|uniref:MliC family protein n=1 Tax=Devosia sp. YR412 TaxID=1881030 RepID=UPI0008C9E702|nr:MliC family protein [Devosia sp. YR412]SEQ41622.1 Membrane-bound inhibitor of C-type lysozyme [Devosia sp. YR412]